MVGSMRLVDATDLRVNGRRTMAHRLDPDARITLGKHELQIKYDPVANGAVGITPPAPPF